MSTILYSIEEGGALCQNVKSLYALCHEMMMDTEAEMQPLHCACYPPSLRQNRSTDSNEVGI